ncbi:MAG: hypothetical protein KAG34_11170, partial [Cocleimonas sp.]|nr:hypothetical protein [Cocleimonas sp.]
VYPYFYWVSVFLFFYYKSNLKWIEILFLVKIAEQVKGCCMCLLVHQIEGEEAKELIVDYFYKTMKISKS